MTGIADNAKSVINAVQLLYHTKNAKISGVTCAAHSLQLCMHKALKEDSISKTIKLSNNLVGHFKHSNFAKQSLLNK